MSFNYSQFAQFKIWPCTFHLVFPLVAWMERDGELPARSLVRSFVSWFVRSLGGSYIQPVESLVDGVGGYGKGVHNSIYHTIQSATYVCSGVPYTVLNVRSIPLFTSNVTRRRRLSGALTASRRATVSAPRASVANMPLCGGCANYCRLYW